MTQNEKHFTSAIIWEAVLVGVTVICAVIGAWKTFAALALLCVLMPLWIIAAACICHMTSKDQT